MKYEFELTLVVRTMREDDKTPSANTWDCHSIDIVMGPNLTSLLGQFLIVLASVHKKVVNDIKNELNVVNDDDDIPF